MSVRARWGLGGALLLAIAILLQPRTAGALEIPAFTAPVVDAAGVVPDDVQANLNLVLNAYQEHTGNQIAIAVVNTTGGVPIEEYSLELANRWGVGTALLDNGVVLVIAYDDHTLRIEVGKGLESRLTNDDAARIINDAIVPMLREGDIANALQAGVGGIISEIDSTTITTDAPRELTNESTGPVVEYARPDASDAVGWAVGGAAVLLVGVPIALVLLAVSFVKRNWNVPMTFGSGAQHWWGNDLHHRHWGTGGSSHHHVGGGTSSVRSSSSGSFSGGGGGSFGSGGASGSW